MTEQISTFFTIDMIYLWLNIGIIPFWFILIFFPNSKVCGAFVVSIFPGAHSEGSTYKGASVLS